MRSALVLCISILLAGCQGFAQPAPQPTPAVIFLAGGNDEAVRTAAATNRAIPTLSAAAGTPAPLLSQSPVPPEQSLPRAGRIMALGARPYLVLRSSPPGAQADAPVVATLPGSQVVWADGRSPDGRWLRVAYGDAGGRAWVRWDDVTLFGEVGDLPQVGPEPAAAPVPTAAPAERPTPGERFQGKIVFQTATGGDIYIVNADGGGLRRLTDGIDPVLSPDGTRVAYARWGAPHGVFILDLRTGQEQRVASVNQPRGPTWSSDGSRLAFTHVTRTRTCVDLGFVCVDPEQLPLILGESGCIDTPQGQRCADDFPVVKIDDNGLVVASPMDGTRQNLISEGTIQSVQWRPGQDQLLFRGKQGLGIIRPGEPPSPLGNDPNINSPAWSPDGQRILAQMHIHDRNEVVLLDANGSVVKYLTQPPPTYEHPGKPAPNNVAPAWSPDGQSILFLSDRDGAWRLYVMNADGSGQRLFLPGVIGQIPLRYDFAVERMVNWGQ